MTTFDGDQPYLCPYSMIYGSPSEVMTGQVFGHACEMAETLLSSYTTYAMDSNNFNAYWANLLPRMQAIFRYAFGPFPQVMMQDVYGGPNYGSVKWDANPNTGTTG